MDFKEGLLNQTKPELDVELKNQTGEMSNQKPKSDNEDRGAAQKTYERGLQGIAIVY